MKKSEYDSGLEAFKQKFYTENSSLKEDENKNENDFDIFKQKFYGEQPKLEESTSQPTENFSQEEQNTDWLRQGTRTVSRGLETLLGLPGDTAQFLTSAAEYIRPEGVEPSIINKGLKYLSEILPTQKSLQELSEKYSGEYTKPQDENEKFYDDVTTTFSSLLGGPQKTGQRVFNRILNPLISGLKKGGQAVAAEYIKDVAKKSNMSEGQQEASKLLTLFLTGRAFDLATGTNTARNAVNNIYKQRDGILSDKKNVKLFNSEPLLNELREVYINELSGSSPSKSAARKFVRSQLKNLPDKISLNDIEEIARDLELSRESLYITNPTKSLQRDARRRWGAVNSVVDKFLENSINKISPEAASLHKQAKAAYAAYQQGEKFSKFLFKNLKKKENLPYSALVSGLGYVSPQAVAGAGAGAQAVASTLGFLQKMRNPNLARYYGDVLTNSVGEYIRSKKDSNDESF